jgi:AGCS family alanine or glycine:cation symporter
MFGVVSTSIAQNFSVSPFWVVVTMFVMVMGVAGGGVKRVGDICSAIIPLFVLGFMGMSLWVLFVNAAAIPAALWTVLDSAFTGHAAVGGFTGGSVLLALTQGIKRGCYTGDIGIGYASVIHAESATESPNRQAALGIFGIVLDTFIICTTSILLILVTDAWHRPIGAELLVQSVLAEYFPGINFFMPLFLFLLGYSTMIAYLCVGFKCAQFLSPKWGRMGYYIYASVAFLGFSVVDPTQALSVMSITGALLLAINSFGIYRLWKDIDFRLD